MAAPLEILLVEDNEGDVEMTLRALRGEPSVCHISVVNDGVEALAFLHREGDFAGAPRPQLILLDLNMPRMDGKRFLETVKANPQFKAVPVVMLTSSEAPIDIKDCYERHASSYVVKPFDGTKFTETVRQVVKFFGGIGRLPPQ